MSIRPIKNQEDYRQALDHIEELMLAKAETEDGDELIFLLLW